MAQASTKKNNLCLSQEKISKGKVIVSNMMMNVRIKIYVGNTILQKKYNDIERIVAWSVNN